MDCAAVCLALEDHPELCAAKRALASAVACVLKESQHGTALHCPQRIENLPDSQFTIIKYWPFRKIVQALLARIPPGFAVDYADVETFLLKHIDNFLRDTDALPYLSSLQAICQAFRVIVNSPFEQQIDKYIFKALFGRMMFIRTHCTTAARRYKEMAAHIKRHSAENGIVLGDGVGCRPFTIDAEKIRAYFDVFLSETTSELESEQSYTEVSDVEGISEGEGRAKKRVRRYVAAADKYAAERATEAVNQVLIQSEPIHLPILYLALVYAPGNTVLRCGTVVYVYQEDEEHISGFVTLQSRVIAVKIDRRLIKRVSKPKKYFSDDVRVKDILVAENQALPEFVRMCGAILLDNRDRAVFDRLLRKDKQQMAKLTSLSNDYLAAACRSVFIAFWMLLEFIKRKLGSLVYGYSISRLGKCISGPASLFAAQIRRSLMKYQANLLGFILHSFAFFCKNDRKVRDFLVSYASDDENTRRILRFWLENEAAVFELLDWAWHGETYDYVM